MRRSLLLAAAMFFVALPGLSQTYYFGAGSDWQVQAGRPTPSIEETVAYINLRISVADDYYAGGSKLSISNDGQNLTVSHPDFPTHGSHEEWSASINALSPTADVANPLSVPCKESVACAVVTKYRPEGNPPHETAQQVHYIPLPASASDEQNRRIENAFQHLLDLLNAQYQSKHPEQPDPFDSSAPHNNAPQYNAPSQRPEPQSSSANDDKASDMEEKISELESDIESDEHSADHEEGLISNCSGAGASICEIGNANARATANKERNKADEARQEIASLKGQEAVVTAKRDTSMTGNYQASVPQQAANQAPVYTSPSAAPSSSRSSGSGAQSSQSCRDMTYCAKVVSSTYANHFLHVVVKNSCGIPIRITTSLYAQNRSCTVGQTTNFNPGDSIDMGAQTDRQWYQIQADDSIRAGYDGSGCKLVIANSCN